MRFCFTAALLMRWQVIGPILEWAEYCGLTNPEKNNLLFFPEHFLHHSLSLRGTAEQREVKERLEVRARAFICIEQHLQLGRRK